MQAKLAANALGRLGGYFYEGESTTTPVNTHVQSACNNLLTPPIAKRLGRTQPDELLEILNSTSETPLVGLVLIFVLIDGEWAVGLGWKMH